MITVQVWSKNPGTIFDLIEDRLGYIRGASPGERSPKQEVLANAQITTVFPPLRDREGYDKPYETIIISSDRIAEGKTLLADLIAQVVGEMGKACFVEDEVTENDLENLGPREKEFRKRRLSEVDVHVVILQVKTPKRGRPRK